MKSANKEEQKLLPDLKSTQDNRFRFGRASMNNLPQYIKNNPFNRINMKYIKMNENENENENEDEEGNEFFMTGIKNGKAKLDQTPNENTVSNKFQQLELKGPFDFQKGIVIKETPQKNDNFKPRKSKYIEILKETRRNLNRKRLTNNFQKGEPLFQSYKNYKFKVVGKEFNDFINEEIEKRMEEKEQIHIIKSKAKPKNFLFDDAGWTPLIPKMIPKKGEIVKEELGIQGYNAMEYTSK